MIYEEFYIDGKEVDIKDVQIVRTYTSPYFKSFDDTSQDTTLSMILPETEKNKAVMEYLSEHDTTTDFPYIKHPAEYIVDGISIFSNGVVHVLAPFEIQVVYGINRETYIKLKEFKLNEIVPNGSTITAQNWVVDWNKGDGSTTKMFSQYYAYKYIKYIKGERKSDYEIDVNGVSQPKADIPDYFKNDANEMSWHPFILATTILGLIRAKAELSTEYNEFSSLYARLANKGLILTGNEDDYVKEFTHSFNGSHGYESMRLYLGDTIFNGQIGKTYYNLTPNPLIPFIEGEIEIKLNIKITNYVTSLVLCGEWFDTETKTLKYEVIQTIPVTSESGGYLFYDTTVKYAIDNGFKYTSGVCIMFGRNTGTLPLSYSVSPVTEIQPSKIDITFTNKKSIYGFPDYYGNTYGRYNCLKNLPKITGLEFLQAICAHVCGFIGTDFRVYYLEDFKTNLTNGVVYDWTGKISNIVDSEYKFNSLEQKNYIKFNNDKDFIDRKYEILVDDETLDAEKDLVTLPFDTPNGDIDKQSEVVLYEQEVKGKSSTTVEGNVITFRTVKPPYRVGDLLIGFAGANMVVYICTTERLTGAYTEGDFELYPERVSQGYPSTPYVIGELAYILNSDRTYSFRLCTYARTSGEIIYADWVDYKTANAKDILLSTPTVPYNKGDMWLDDLIIGGRRKQYIANVNKAVGDAYDFSDWDLITNETNTTFTTQPTAPYYVGDLWIDGDKVYVCTADNFVSFDDDDWTIKINSLTDYITDISSDGVLTPQEKKGLRLEWEACLAEKTRLATESTNFGVTTEYTNYNQAFIDLSTYLNDNEDWTSGIPLWLNDTYITSNTDIVAADFRNNWKTFYDKRTILNNKLTQLAKEYDPFFIGGYNFIKNSNLAKGLVDGWAIYNANNNEIIYTGLPSGATHGYKFKAISGFGGIYFQRSALKIVAGKTYTLSFYAKADSVCEMQYGDEGITRDSVTLTSIWQRVVKTFTASTSSNISFYVDLNDDFTYVTNFQLEAGSNVSDWNNNPDTKLSAFDYLAEAMTDEAGFETVGGLALAKVILVRGSDSIIRGGFSGLQTDELLLWGGTYQDALDGIANVVIKKGGEFFLGGEQNRRKVEVTMQNLDTLTNYINRTFTTISYPTITSPLLADTDNSLVGIGDPYSAVKLLDAANGSVTITLTEEALLNLNVYTQHEIVDCPLGSPSGDYPQISYTSYVKIRKTYDENNNPVSEVMYLKEFSGSDVATSLVNDFVRAGARLVGGYYLPKGKYIIESSVETEISNLGDTFATGHEKSRIYFSDIKYTITSAKTVLGANGFGCVRDAYNYFYLSQSISNDYFLQGRGDMQWLSEDGTKGLRVTNEGVQKYNGSTWVTL